MGAERPANESKDALGQLRDLSDAVNSGWLFAQQCLSQATYECIDVDDDQHAELQMSFWAAHVKLLEESEKKTPGVAERVFVRFEEIAAEKRAMQASEDALEDAYLKKGLRRYKQKAFVRGLFGLNVEPITYEEIMASRRQGDGIADL